MNSRRLWLLLLAVGLAFPPTASAQEQHQRDTWYIGFGLGGALSAQFDANGQTVSFDDWLTGYEKDPKVSANFKVGLTLSPKTLVGIDLTGTSQTGSLNGLDATAQINNAFLMLTHFPNQEGLFVRAGARPRSCGSWKPRSGKSRKTSREAACWPGSATRSGSARALTLR